MRLPQFHVAVMLQRCDAAMESALSGIHSLNASDLHAYFHQSNWSKQMVQSSLFNLQKYCDTAEAM